MQYPVSVLARGLFSQKAVAVKTIDLPPLPPEIIKAVDEHWLKELEKNPDLTSGPLLVGMNMTPYDDGRRLVLTGAVSNYKNFMGTTDPSVPEQYRHRAVGFLAVTVTSDKCVLLGVRSPRIDWGNLRHVVPAGRLRPSELDPFTGIRLEFQDELGLLPHEIQDLVCVGVVGDNTWNRMNYEFCFLAKTPLTARQVIERAKSAKSAHEHCQLEPFPWDKSFLPELLLADPEGYVPTGWAGIVLSLWTWFGENTFPGWESITRSYEDHMGRRLPMARK